MSKKPVFTLSLTRWERSFAFLSAGQLVSSLGARITAFSLGIWVFQSTGSIEKFALVHVAALLPAIITSPFVGGLADRKNKRWIICGADIGCALCTLTLLVSALGNNGEIPLSYIYAYAMAISVFGSLRAPTYSASIGLLVTPPNYGRANGVMQFVRATSQLIAPITAGALMTVLSISEILKINMMAYLIAVVTCLLVSFPRTSLEHSAAEKSTTFSQWRDDLRHSISYIQTHRELMLTAISYTAYIYIVGVVTVLTVPLALTIVDELLFGAIMSLAGFGMLAASAIVTAWQGPTDRIAALFLAQIVSGIAILLAGVQPSVPLIAFAAFLFFFAVPFVSSLFQTIWQHQVQPSSQGRVFALRNTILQTALLLAYVTAGPISERIFEPLLAEGGPLIDSVGRWIGIGPGRGIALLFVLLGSTTALVSAVQLHRQRIRTE